MPTGTSQHRSTIMVITWCTDPTFPPLWRCPFVASLSKLAQSRPHHTAPPFLLRTAHHCASKQAAAACPRHWQSVHCLLDAPGRGLKSQQLAPHTHLHAHNSARRLMGTHTACLPASLRASLPACLLAGSSQPLRVFTTQQRCRLNGAYNCGYLR